MNELPIGYILNNNYEILERLNSGGFGITYLVYHNILRKEFVIKEYFPSSLYATRGINYSVECYNTDDFERGRSNFEYEAKLLHGLTNDNIIGVEHVFTENNTVYFVMPYVAKLTLEDWTKQNTNPSQEKLCDIFIPLLEGLNHIHGLELYHTDIKPKNILIAGENDGRYYPILIDFGSALYAEEQDNSYLIRTKSDGYSPIEIDSRSQPIKPSLDLYSLSACIYECIVGKRVPEAIARFQNDTIIILSENEEYLKIYTKPFLSAIDKCLNMRAEDRYQTAKEFQDALLSQEVEVEDCRDNPSDNKTKNNETIKTTSDGVIEDVSKWPAGQLGVSDDLHPAKKTSKSPMIIAGIIVLATLVVLLLIFFGGSENDDSKKSNLNGNALTITDDRYKPKNPIDGNIQAVAFLQPSGYVLNIVEMDKDKNWKILKREQYEYRDNSATTARELQSSAYESRLDKSTPISLLLYNNEYDTSRFLQNFVSDIENSEYHNMFLVEKVPYYNILSYMFEFGVPKEDQKNSILAHKFDEKYHFILKKGDHFEVHQEIDGNIISDNNIINLFIVQNNPSVKQDRYYQIKEEELPEELRKINAQRKIFVDIDVGSSFLLKQ